MRVAALYADVGGCAHYRVHAPARAAMLADSDVEVIPDTGLNVDATEDKTTGLMTVHKIDTDVDVIVIQRPLHNSWTSMIEAARRQGIATVVEIDDDFDSVHPKNMSYAKLQPEANQAENREWLRRAAHEADFVTVSTPRLAEVYGSHGRVAVLNNYVPRDVLDIEHEEGTPLRVGWTGTTQTHPTDLEVTRPGVAQAVRDVRGHFRVVGDQRGVVEQLGLARSIEIRDTGWVRLASYLDKVADFIDVGIVPLDRIVFNESKSWLKGLEFAALGIPFVASPSLEYQRLVSEYGLGYLAATPSEWRRQLKRLLTDHTERREVGLAYRERVRANLVSEDHGDEWVAAWKRALDVSRGLR